MKKTTFLSLLSVCLCYSETLEIGNISGISFEELNNNYIVTYKPKTNELKQSYYYLKNGQFYKSVEQTIYPTNKLNSNNYRLFEYKKELKNLSCIEYKAKDCINLFLQKNRYFEYDGEKVYILPKEKEKIYNIIKYNYNKTL